MIKAGNTGRGGERPVRHGNIYSSLSEAKSTFNEFPERKMAEFVQ